jgi:hypothetical protein
MLTRVWQELEYRIDVCRVTRGAHIEHFCCQKKKFSVFLWLWTIPLSFRFLAIIVCNHGEHYETLCVPPPHGATALSVPRHRQCRRFTITQTHTTLGRTPLEEGSARRRDLYLTTHNTHKRQTSMHPAGLEPTIPASELPQTHALERAVIGIDRTYL